MTKHSSNSSSQGNMGDETRRKMTRFIKVVKNNDLTIVMLPPSRYNNTNFTAEQPFTKWFKFTHRAWEIDIFRALCSTCDSPFCFFGNNKVVLRSLLLKIEKMKGKSNKQKRFSAYEEGAQAMYPNMGEGACIRLGFCFVERVRTIFPDDEYKGLRY